MEVLTPNNTNATSDIPDNHNTNNNTAIAGSTNNDSHYPIEGHVTSINCSQCQTVIPFEWESEYCHKCGAKL